MTDHSEQPTQGQLLFRNVQQTLAFGFDLVRLSANKSTIYLQGELGTGKTTLVRGLLRGLGYSGTVRSPSYTLMEIYQLEGIAVCHLDLYRVKSGAELEDIGFREVFSDSDLRLVEWPESGGTYLPPPDLVLKLSHEGPARRVHWVNHSLDEQLWTGVLNGVHADN